MKRFYAPTLAVAFSAFSAYAAEAPAIVATLHDKTGDHRFTVEYARTAAEQKQGLMFRSSLAADHGMLFVFDPPYAVSMWMKNTEIPLDMLFLNGDRRVSYIVHDARPQDLTPLGNGEETAAVIELPGGTAKRLGVALGDLVDYAVPAS